MHHITTDAPRQMTKRSRDEQLSGRPAISIRRCRVCEWQDEVIERSGEEHECPWCHSPTERVSTVVIADAPSGADTKNPHASALGRLGGAKGGHARAAKLTAQQRRLIASRAARARWGQRKPKT